MGRTGVAEGRRKHGWLPSLTVLVTAAVMSLTACSVSVPRNGWAGLAAGRTGAGGAGGSGQGAAGGDASSNGPLGNAQNVAGGAGGTGQGGLISGGGSQANGAGAPSGSAGPSGSAAPSGSAGPGTTVGVTDSTITISADGSFSGPFAAIYEQQYRASALTWRDQVNASGGINGRKIVIKKVDDQFTVEGSVAACKAIESNGSFVAFTQSLFDNGLACLDQAGVPSLESGISLPNPDGLGWRYIRSMFSSDGVGATIARFVLSSQGLNRAGHKIGIIYVDDQPDELSAANAFMAAARQLGLQVYGEKIATNQPTFTAQLERLRNEGVDTIVMDCVFESVGIMRDAKALAYNPVWTGYLFNADEVAAAGSAVFQGIKAPRIWPGADSAAFQQYKQTVAKYGETTAPTTTNYGGYACLLVMQRALELAGRDLTREKFLAAFNQIQNFDSGGYPPVSYSPGHIVGTDQMFPLECCNSDATWKSIGPHSDFR